MISTSNRIPRALWVEDARGCALPTPVTDMEAEGIGGGTRPFPASIETFWVGTISRPAQGSVQYQGARDWPHSIPAVY